MTAAPAVINQRTGPMFANIEALMERRQHAPARLRDIAALVDTAPPEQFNMRRWLEAVTMPFKDPEGRKLMPGECGTAACAIGWSVVAPWARGGDIELLLLRDESPNRDTATPYAVDVHGNAESNINAVMWFFGLSLIEADQLFVSCMIPESPACVEEFQDNAHVMDANSSREIVTHNLRLAADLIEKYPNSYFAVPEESWIDPIDFTIAGNPLPRRDGDDSDDSDDEG